MTEPQDKHYTRREFLKLGVAATLGATGLLALARERGKSSPDTKEVNDIRSLLNQVEDHPTLSQATFMGLGLYGGGFYSIMIKRTEAGQYYANYLKGVVPKTNVTYSSEHPEAWEESPAYKTLNELVTEVVAPLANHEVQTQSLNTWDLTVTLNNEATERLLENSYSLDIQAHDSTLREFMAQNLKIPPEKSQLAETQIDSVITFYFTNHPAEDRSNKLAWGPSLNYYYSIREDNTRPPEINALLTQTSTENVYRIVSGNQEINIIPSELPEGQVRDFFKQLSEIHEDLNNQLQGFKL